jgi:hypothetical protein
VPSNLHNCTIDHLLLVRVSFNPFGKVSGVQRDDLMCPPDLAFIGAKFLAQDLYLPWATALRRFRRTPRSRTRQPSREYQARLT